MSLLNELNPIMIKLPTFRNIIPRNINLSTPQKITALSFTVGVSLIWFLARYFRRRRRTLNPGSSKFFHLRSKWSGTKSPNGDVPGGVGVRCGSPSARSLNRQGSVISADRLSVLSGSIGVHGFGDGAAASLTPQQLGVMGMEALETAVSYWEDALSAYTSAHTAAPLTITDAEEAAFVRDLQQLLDAAYRLQTDSETMFLDQRSVLFRTDSSSRLFGDNLTSITSNPESFVSAQDEIADLREFEEFTDFTPDIENLELYQTALKRLDEAGIPYRCLRTEMVKCTSDVEYLAKLHCIRLGFQFLFKEHSMWQWFADTGRQILTDLILFADKDPKEFLVTYEDMLEFLQDDKNWIDIEQELSLKGVKAMTFYDVVLDYILMDAFEDLDSPPSSVTAVVQNRWLSNGFKESALSTCVWSILKAKRRMLKYPEGFMAHFYSISEHMSPLMAWGYLGPDENLRDICHYFRDQVMGFLLDIFSFHRTRFGKIEDLSADLFEHAKKRVDIISHKMSGQV